MRRLNAGVGTGFQPQLRTDQRAVSRQRDRHVRVGARFERDRGRQRSGTRGARIFAIRPAAAAAASDAEEQPTTSAWCPATARRIAISRATSRAGCSGLACRRPLPWSPCRLARSMAWCSAYRRGILPRGAHWTPAIALDPTTLGIGREHRDRRRSRGYRRSRAGPQPATEGQAASGTAGAGTAVAGVGVTGVARGCSGTASSWCCRRLRRAE